MAATRLRIPREGRPLGLLLAFTGMFLVSTDSLLVRVAEQKSNVDGWTIAFMVGLFSMPVSWGLAFRSMGNDTLRQAVRWRRPLLVTGLLGGIGTTSFLTAVTLTSAANVVAIIASGPIFAAVLSRLALRERTSPRTWRSIGLVMAGIVVIVGGSMAGGGIAGDLVALLAIMVFAVNLVVWRKFPDLPRTLVVAVTATFIVIVTVGFADPGPDGTVYNALAICRNGQVLGTVHKECLPTYDVFDEARDFQVGTGPLQLFRVAGVRVGLAICEDLWVPGGPVERLVAGGAEMVATINGSPYHRGKQAARESVVTATATWSGRPVAYVNLVGGQDQLVFDGGSMVADPAGRIIGNGPRFEEAVVRLDVDVDELPAPPDGLPVVDVSDPVDRSDHLVVPPLAPLDEVGELYEALVLATRDYVHKSGFSDVCLGLSGGVDSALVATVAADALGPDRVHAVLMPSRHSSEHSVTDAEDLVSRQGLDDLTLSIEEVHRAFGEVLTTCLLYTSPSPRD